MSTKLILVAFSLIGCLALISSKFLKKSVLSEEMFSVNLKCSIPGLALSIAEFQVAQEDKVISIVDIEKTFKESGIENNQETNPTNVKFINLVFNKKTNKIGIFWQNTKNEVFVERPAKEIVEMVTSCAIWLRDFMHIAKSIGNATSSPLENDEDKFGNAKFSYDDKNKEVIYGFIFQDENLTAITQQRTKEASLLSNLIAFAENAKSIGDSEFLPIPEGIHWEEE